MACGFLDLILDPEGGGNTFLENPCGLLPDYRALHFTRHRRENLKSNMETADYQILHGRIKSLILGYILELFVVILTMMSVYTLYRPE
jgi:hypothetical protein